MIRVREGKNDELLEVPCTPVQQEVLRKVLSRSLIYSAYLDGVVAAAWGLIPPTLLSESAYVWLLTTPLAERHKFLLVRYSQLFVEEMLKKFPELVGDVILPNDRAIRWIKWLGGEFREPQGSRLPFIIRRNNG